MSIGEKGTLPAEVVNDMKKSALMGGMVPKSFVEYHLALAKRALPALVSRFRVEVVTTFVKSGGWFDGMNNLHAIIRKADNTLLEIVWYASDGSGYWMKDVGCGQAMLFPEDVGTPLKYMVCGLEGGMLTFDNESAFVMEMERRGFKETSRSDSAPCHHPNLWDRPTFDKLCGPMKHDDYIRYDTWEEYEALSR
jgi:hypothetical protein